MHAFFFGTVQCCFGEFKIVLLIVPDYIPDDLWFHQICFILENVLEAGKCVVDTQCGETENKRRCIGERCVCVEGYSLIENNCREGKLTKLICNGH